MYYQIQTDATDKRWWDYSALVSTRNARSRLICVMGMAFFGQWYESLIPSFLRSSRYLASVTSLGIEGEGLLLCYKQEVSQNFRQKGLIVWRALLERVHLLLEVGEKWSLKKFLPRA